MTLAEIAAIASNTGGPIAGITRSMPRALA